LAITGTKWSGPRFFGLWDKRPQINIGGSNDIIGSTCQISAHLKARSICTKAKTSTGKTRGGIPFGRGALSHLLRNRFFIGEVKYRGELLPGEQPAIIDKALFEAVQQKLSDHQSHRTLTRQKADHLLKDLLFDDAGHRMIATHATKAGVRYRYYVSQPGLHGEARTAKLGSISRVLPRRSNKQSSPLFRDTSQKKDLLRLMAKIRLNSTTMPYRHSCPGSKCSEPNWSYH